MAATWGASGGVAAGLMDSGETGVALPCASARRSRFPPEVVDDISRVGRNLSPRVRAVIRELDKTTFALNFLETGGVAEPCQKCRTPSCA